MERDRSLSSIINQYRNTVKPMHEKYVQPSRRNADIVILNGGLNPVANGMIETLIKNHISGYYAE
ncbi:MAG: uridine kinase, partial [Clostridia bacterium]|nr:uridine kinase [Clostridia bacterium]